MLYALLALLALLLILILIAVARTLLLPNKETFIRPSTDQARIDRCARDLSELIKVETVSRRGETDPAKFRAMHDKLAQLYPRVFAELEKTDIDGNLLMRWKGRDPSLAPIALTSHLDVVPAEGKWTHDPFGGEIADGKVYGRGAGDIKEGVMCFYRAVEELLEEGYSPACDVYLCSSCTEEIGGDGAPKLAKWFADRGIRLFLLSDEGGGIVKDPVAGVKGDFAAIGIFEKGYGDIRFSARSSGGHSSTPPKNTPIPRLARFEAAVEKKSPFKARFSPAVDAMFENLAPYCKKFGLKLVMHNLWLFRPLVKRLLPTLSPEAAAMLRTTITFTMQQGSGGYNVIPQEAWVTANLRYIPHQGMDESNRLICDMAKKYGLESEIVTASEPTRPLELDGLAYRIAVESVKAVFPGIGIMPYVVTGGTDSRFYGDVCDGCVRFSPVRMGPEQMATMHGIDENIEVDSLPGGVDWYKDLIRRQEQRA